MSQTAPKPSWKEEVNRKLEAHKSRRGIAVVGQQAPRTAQPAVSDRAAQAAARVAARYAQAPSFSEMQAAEARAALRAAEEATRKALEAQAAAHAMLAGLIDDEDEFEEPETDPALMVAESATAYQPVLPVEQAPQPNPLPHAPRTTAAHNSEAPAVQTPVARTPVHVRWEPDLPALHAQPEPSRTALLHAEPESPAELWLAEPQADAIETVEAAQPIAANLIQFPRELVATRRMRPRLQGAPLSSSEEAHGQLSIFEVDPDTISIEPALVAESAPAPSWSTGADWASLELDHPAEEAEPESREALRAAALDLAPLSLRLMAALVDGALILALAAGIAAGAASQMTVRPALRSVEMMAAGLLLVIGFVYHLVCLTVLKTTPGMRYAGIALCTFEDEQPSPAQLRERLMAMLVSLLPLGLGIAWLAFDENHLCWHDRLSRTYLRQC